MLLIELYVSIITSLLSNMSANTNTSFTVNNISLYIPKVFENITKEKMTSIFEFLDIGMINHIDFVTKVDNKGKPYNSAYIHFDFWYSNISNQNLQERLKNSIECRIVYDDPWYWIVLENKATKKDYSIPKPKINLEGLVLPKKEVLFLPRVLGKTSVIKIPRNDFEGDNCEVDDFETRKSKLRDCKEHMWDLEHEKREDRD
jgi:hypothetical protein